MRALRSDHVSPALMRVLDRLDTPAMVVSDLSHTLVQNPLATALLGDHTRHTGHARSIVYRYFTDPEERRIYPEADHGHHARVFVAGLRAVTARGPDPEASELVTELTQRSPEFRRLWDEHEVAVRTSARKRMVHPVIGTITLDCQTLVAENQAQALLPYTATPGTEDYDKLELLPVLGVQQFDTDLAQPSSKHA